MRVTTPDDAVTDRAQVESSRHRASQRPGTTGDPAGLLYGALIAASVLATASAHVEDFPFIALATAFVLGVYWLAHVYVAAQALHQGRRSFLRRLADVAGHEASLLKGGLPAIVVYVVLDVLGLSTRSAAAYAVYFSVAVLVYVGYLTAVRADRHGWASVLDAAAAGGLGVIVIIAKTLLH
jgi:hypothetical protein